MRVAEGDFGSNKFTPEDKSVEMRVSGGRKFKRSGLIVFGRGRFIIRN